MKGYYLTSKKKGKFLRKKYSDYNPKPEKRRFLTIVKKAYDELYDIEKTEVTNVDLLEQSLIALKEYEDAEKSHAGAGSQGSCTELPGGGPGLHPRNGHGRGKALLKLQEAPVCGGLPRQRAQPRVHRQGKGGRLPGRL